MKELLYNLTVNTHTVMQYAKYHSKRIIAASDKQILFKQIV